MFKLAKIILSLPLPYSLRKFFLKKTLGKMGENVYISPFIYIDNPKEVFIGNDVYIGKFTKILGGGSVFISNGVYISPEVSIITITHNIHTMEEIHKEVKIEEYSWIATRAVILPGVTIGKGSIVAAGAVVTKNVPPYTVVAGVPAKVIGFRERKLMVKYRLPLGRDYIDLSNLD